MAKHNGKADTASDTKRQLVEEELYVLAAGIWPDSATARLTLQVEPKPTGQTTDDEQAMTLENWPASIAARLNAGITLTFLPLEGSNPDQAPRPSRTLKDPIVMRATSLGLAEKDARAAASLWRAMLGEADSYPDFKNPKDGQVEVTRGTWVDLVNSLKLSQANVGAAGGPGLHNGTGDVDPLNDDGVGAEGQIRPSPASDQSRIAGILPVPHSDLALALDQQRAEELCLSLGELLGQSGLHDKAEGNRRQKLKQDPIFPKLSALLEAAEPPNQEQLTEVLGKVIDITPLWPEFASAENTPEQALRRLRKCLKQAERARLSKALRNSRATTAKAYCSEQKRLQEGSCDIEDVDTPARFCGAEAHDEATREKVMAQACAAHHYASWPQYVADGEDPPEPPKPDQKPLTETAIVQRYAALKSDPVLSRVFGLSVDLELATEDFQDLKDGFYLVAVSLGTSPPVTEGLGATWTLLEVKDQGGAVKFWPATERAAYVSLSGKSDTGFPRQSHGLMTLSGAPCSAEAEAPRFDLTSIELRTATEAEMQRRLSRQSNIDTDATVDAQNPESDPTPTNPPPEADNLSLGGKYLTGGLTLLIRSAGTDTAVRLARRDERLVNDQDVVLDADDLTTGVRPFVGIPEGNGTRWSQLTARNIDYGTSGLQTNEIRVLVGKLFPRNNNKLFAWRRALEAGFLTTPSRLLPTGTEDQEAVVEEAFTTWDGSPMGVDITSQSNASRDVQVFGRTLTLPKSSLDTLRFGVPYRFALAAVYSGGVSRQAAGLPSDTEGDPAFYPVISNHEEKKGARPFFRFLRQESIAAPQFALPLGHALRSEGEKRRTGTKGSADPLPYVHAGPMGFDTGPRMVVRSLGPKITEDDKDYGSRMTARAAPNICHRVVLAPNMVFDCAEWHGAFDSSTEKRPTGAYDNFAGARATVGDRNDRENLIVARTHLLRGLDNRGFLDKRTYTDWPNPGTASDTATLGDALIKRPKWLGNKRPTNLSNENRLNRFYEDPLARNLAFGIRLKGESTYLEGGPLIYDVSDTKVKLSSGHKVYSRLPVVVTSVIGNGPARPAPSRIQDVVTVDNKTAYRWFDADTEDDGFTSSNRYMPAFELRLELRPGEEIEIDIWALPSEGSLARDHALVQAFGIKLCASGKATGLSSADAMLAGAKSVLPQQFSDRLETELAKQGADNRRYVAPGGIFAPTNAALKALGNTITHMLKLGPLPEFAGVTTLEAVHATNRMPTRPTALKPAVPQDPMLSELPPVDENTPEPRPVSATRPASVEENPFGPLAVSAPGSTHLVLDGTVPFDTNTNDVIEIEAQVTLPGSSNFDDRNRGRSLAHRRKGTWPPLRTLDGSTRKDKDDQPLYRNAEDLFGFDVGRDGTVSFQPAKVTLLRVEGLPRRLPRGQLDLRSLFLNTLPDGARVAHRHVFPDGKARRMHVRVNALSRTMDDLRTCARVARPGDPWTSPKEGRLYGTGEHVPAEPVPASHQLNPSDPVEIILPATVRPAKPDARAPLPLLEFESGQSKANEPPWLWHNRTASIRIPLGREWFSSGEDEMVGLVLWPPIGEEEETRTGGKVSIPGRYPGDPDRRLDLDKLDGDVLTFSDDDLGPGGRFISRRGSDPVRGGSETEPVLRPIAIADLFRDQKDARRAKMVENVLMPLDDESSTVGNQKQSSTPPMRVALALYQPRFDVEREEWFIDVTLKAPLAPDGFVRLGLVRYQPHAVPELRCSRPVVQWAQPLSTRALRARRDAPGRIFIELEGPAPKERALPNSITCDKTPELGVDRAALFCQPAMRLTLFRQKEENGQTRRVMLRRRTKEVVRLTANADEDNEKDVPAPQADAILVTPERLADSMARWRHVLNLSDYEDSPNDGQLQLLVEEIEHFRPASYADEPVAAAIDAAWRTEFQEAGPRFSALLELKAFE
ncbi:hypothetical protein [Ruegeria denitrificans]|uniref:hypothetical protein n=1 Tax=Ruegeria denitrificans TaxID=1715692 RepID=UPI003C7AC8CF